MGETGSAARRIILERLIRAVVPTLLVISGTACVGVARTPESVGGPWIDIPGTVDCSVQLSAGIYKSTFLPGEPIPVDAVLRVRGSCSWPTYSRNSPRDFILIIDRIDPDGNVIHLANEETYWANDTLGWGEPIGLRHATVDAEHSFRVNAPIHLWFDCAITQTSMYDLSPAGEYTVQLVFMSPYEPYRIPSNVITFRREP